MAATYGFPCGFRLRTPADFQYVFQNAQKSSDAFLTVLARPTSLGHARLGLAIAKKHLRKATDRNRIKRLARESFRFNHSTLGSLDFIVMAKPACKQADSLTLRKSIDKHWTQLKKRCNSSSCNSSSSTVM